MKRKTVIEVKKGSSESNGALLRRFSRRVQEASIINIVKKKRFNDRPAGKLARKAYAIKRIEKRANKEKLRKLGKIQ